MKNLVVNVMKKFGVAAMCLSLVLGVLGMSGVTAQAASQPVTMQTIYTEGTQATLIVKVRPAYYEKYGVTLICKNASGEQKTFTVTAKQGTVDLGNGNSATVTRDWGEDNGIYVITYKIQKSTIPAGARAYFVSGDAKADNGGYGYYMFG